MLVQCAHSQKVSRGRSTIASQVNMARTSAVESANATRHARPQLAAVPPGCRDTLAHCHQRKIFRERGHCDESCEQSKMTGSNFRGPVHHIERVNTKIFEPSNQKLSAATCTRAVCSVSCIYGAAYMRVVLLPVNRVLVAVVILLVILVAILVAVILVVLAPRDLAVVGGPRIITHLFICE